MGFPERRFIIQRRFTLERIGKDNSECVLSRILKTVDNCRLFLIGKLENRLCKGNVDRFGDGKGIIMHQQHNSRTSILQSGD